MKIEDILQLEIEKIDEQIKQLNIARVMNKCKMWRANNMIIKLMMLLIYIKYFIKYLLINLFTEKQHGYLVLVDDEPEIIAIVEEHHHKTLTYDEYIHEIDTANELTLNKLIVDIYNNNKLNEDERFELDCYVDLIHQ